MVINNELTRIVYELQRYGFIDVILPFLLIFTLIFATLQRIKLFGEDKKSINIVVSLIMAILSVVPHVTGNYPGRYDPIVIINTLLPSVSVLAVVIILVLFLWGMFGGEWSGKNVPGYAMIFVILIIGYIFGATVGWWATPSATFGSWWTNNLSTLVIIILIFGAIFFFITREDKTAGEGVFSGLKEFGKLFGGKK